MREKRDEAFERVHRKLPRQVCCCRAKQPSSRTRKENSRNAHPDRNYKQEKADFRANAKGQGERERKPNLEVDRRKRSRERKLRKNRNKFRNLSGENFWRLNLLFLGNKRGEKKICKKR